MAIERTWSSNKGIYAAASAVELLLRVLVQSVVPAHQEKGRNCCLLNLTMNDHVVEVFL